MGFLKGLQQFNQTVNSIQNKKEELKTLTDKSQRSADDIKNIRKSKLWSLANLVIVIAYCVGMFFILRLLFSELFIGVILYVVLGGTLVITLLRKCIAFTNDDAPSLGAHFFAKFNLVLLIIGSIAVVIGTLLTLGLL